jgi:hypothetical protein
MWYLANKNCVLTKSLDFSYGSTIKTQNWQTKIVFWPSKTGIYSTPSVLKLSQRCSESTKTGTLTVTMRIESTNMVSSPNKHDCLQEDRWQLDSFVPHWDRFGHAEPLPHGFPCPQHRLAQNGPSKCRQNEIMKHEVIEHDWSSKLSSTQLLGGCFGDAVACWRVRFLRNFQVNSYGSESRQQKWSKLKHILS